ncbi:acyl dehydratase [Mycolicibacterium porcinum]|uniref:MaoC family dehydratase n=1 Tax=Mycolicibacterium porcinum TaxID=39693 RepID=UPI0011962183|nr:MaoC family dehydratase [Mycolicibacterium porcinum]TVX96007.1 acyl dehydratase [Mycolicibacterium porcinum]
MTTHASSGPYFDELTRNTVFDWSPALTLTSGGAALHQAILGDRLRLPLDRELSRAVTGQLSVVAHPAYVCDVAIGQSTLATQRVKANLFYRGLRFHRFPAIGDSLYTRTEVVGLRQNSTKPGRPSTGLAALRITTVDQADRLVLDFHRCAMLPLSDDSIQTGYNDDLSGIGTESPADPGNPIAGWRTEEFRRRATGPDLSPELTGTTLRSTADVVSSATELARLTLNIAATHHDSRIAGQRLVYGGHTIGLALAQATRLLPNLVTVLGWQSCDHSGPVHEGDTLYSDLVVEDAMALAGDRGTVLNLRSVVYAADDGADRQVLDWKFTALHF